MNRSRYAAIAALLVFCVAMTACAQERTGGRASWLSEADDYLARLASEGDFSGSALIAVDGEALLAKGYGLANREHGIPNGPNTKFRLGSLTKQITAMVCLILEERGDLNLDDKVSKHLPRSPDSWEDITLLHLLNHTSGIPSFTSFPDNLRHERLPTTVGATVDRFIDKPLDFEPGAQYRYSNSGYALLGLVIELVTGKAYEDVVKELVFQPLRMANSGYDRPRTVLENRASGYSRIEGVIHNAIHFEMDTPHAAGALYSTVNDLLIWDQALYSEDLVSREAIRKMETSYLSNYGLGVGIRDGKVLHGGGISGFRTYLIRIPEHRICVAVLSNFEFADPSDIAEHLADLSLSGLVE